MGFFRLKRPGIVSCDEARKTVLLTGGLRLVCPDEDEKDSKHPHLSASAYEKKDKKKLK